MENKIHSTKYDRMIDEFISDMKSSEEPFQFGGGIMSIHTEFKEYEPILITGDFKKDVDAIYNIIKL